MKKIALVGLGGLGKEIAAYIFGISSNIEICGYYDDEMKETQIPYLGSFHELANKDGCLLLFTFSNPLLKSLLISKTKFDFSEALIYGYSFSKNSVGRGSVICPGAVLTSNVVVGQHCLINLNSTIGHDVEIGDFSSIMPGSNISGNVKIGKGVLIGTGAQILQGINISDNAKVGAGAVVTKDVEAGVTVVGVPARELKN